MGFSSRTYRAALVLCLLVLIAGGTTHIFFGSSGPRPSVIGSDDAYITYRYARNLFRGEGLVFNPGERVEGYSTLAYVLLISPAFAFVQDEGIYFFAAFVNLVLAGVALLVVAGFLRERFGDRLAILGTLLFALFLPLWAAIGSGMETCLVLLLAIAIWVTTERLVEHPDQRRTGLWCLLGVLSLLSRADGFLVPCTAIAYLFLKRKTRTALGCTAVLGAALVLYEAWRVRYYGDLLPNTYYIRMTGPLLWRARYALQRLSWIAHFGGLLPYLVVFCFGWIDFARSCVRRRGLDTSRIRLDVILALEWIAYWFLVGGDHISDRFLLILLPLGIYGLLHFLREESNATAVALLVVLFAVLAVDAPRRADHRFRFTRTRYDAFLVAGRFLRTHHPGKTLAAPAIGKIPFILDTQTTDMLGLIDPVISRAPPTERKFFPGHVKFDADRTLSKQPDLIVDWIDASTFDLRYGLDRRRLETAGYRIEYLVHTGHRTPDEAIVRVEGMTDEEISRLVNDWHEVAILVKSTSRPVTP